MNVPTPPARPTITDAPAYSHVAQADAATADRYQGAQAQHELYIDVAQGVQKQEQEIAGALYDQRGEQGKRISDLAPPRPTRPQRPEADRDRSHTPRGR